MLGVEKRKAKWFEAVRSGNIVTLDWMINEGMDLNIKDRTDNTALMIAVRENKIKVVNRLIEGNPTAVLDMLLEWRNSGRQLSDQSILKWRNRIVVDVNGKCRGQTVLMEALEEYNHLRSSRQYRPSLSYHNKKNKLILKLKIIKLLINAGANFNTDYMGFHSKALINAAEMGDKVMARLLIKAGGDVKNSRALTNTIGCYNYDNEDKKERVVKLLISLGANVNTKDEQGRTALMEAARNRNEKMIQLLINNGADVRNSTALIDAVGGYSYDDHKKERIVMMLIRSGANVNTKDEWDRTALMEAARNGCESIVQLLIDNGADVKNSTALISAVGCYGNDEDKKERIVMLLIRSGANVNAKDKQGRTALMEAARNGCETIVPLLINNGADVKNSTALIDAVESYGNDEDKKERIVMLLIRSRANVNAKDEQGRTALMEAARNGYEKMVQLLIDNGTDVNAATMAIRAAVKIGNERIVKLLIDAGADINTYNTSTRNKLLYKALIMGKEGIVKLLLNAGVSVGKDDLRQAQWRVSKETRNLMETVAFFRSC